MTFMIDIRFYRDGDYDGVATLLSESELFRKNPDTLGRII